MNPICKNVWYHFQSYWALWIRFFLSAQKKFCRKAESMKQRSGSLYRKISPRRISRKIYWRKKTHQYLPKDHQEIPKNILPDIWWTSSSLNLSNRRRDINRRRIQEAFTRYPRRKIFHDPRRRQNHYRRKACRRRTLQRFLRIWIVRHQDYRFQSRPCRHYDQSSDQRFLRQSKSCSMMIGIRYRSLNRQNNFPTPKRGNLQNQISKKIRSFPK